MASSYDVSTRTPSAIGDLVKKRQWEDVKELLRDDPALSFWTDSSNSRTPLHLMCRIDFGQRSGDGSNGDRDGCIESEQPWPPHVEVAQMLIDASHECDPVVLPNFVRLDRNGEGGEDSYKLHMSVLTVRDYLGDTPLHNLCGHLRSACPYLTQLILVSTSDYMRITKGDDYIVDDVDEEERVRMRAPSTYDLLTTKNARGCTPLHFVAEGSAPWDVSKLVLDACKCAELAGCVTFHPMLAQDEDGDTPLHFACSAGAEVRLLRYLLDGETSVVHVANREGGLPVDDLIVSFVDEIDSESEVDSHVSLLERAATDMLSSLWEKIEVLLRAAWKCSSSDGKNKELPFRPVHAAANVNWPSIILRLACKLFPDEVSARNDNGLTPLHVAASQCIPEGDMAQGPCGDSYPELVRWGSGHEDHTMITFLTSLCPDSAQLPTDNRQFPLHMAIESGKCVSDIHHLLSLCPWALEIRDVKSGLYPFMLAAATPFSSLDSVYFLLTQNPELIRSRIEN